MMAVPGMKHAGRDPFVWPDPLRSPRAQDQDLRMAAALTLALSCLLLLAPADLAQAKRDPDTGVVRLLHLGKVWEREKYPGPIFKAEPRIAWTPVPAYFTPDCVCHHATTYGEREVREMRMRLPRSKNELVSKYDVVVIDAMFAFDMPAELATWIVQAVEEDGLGFMMVDDEVTFAGRGLAPSWYLAPIGEILPVDDQPSYYDWNQRFQIMPVIEDHPLVKGLDFSNIWVEANNRPSPKPGCTVIAEMSPNSPWNIGVPVMAYWDLGEGRSFAYIHRWHSETGNFYEWKNHADFLCHLIYFTAQIPIPQNLEQIHTTRSKMAEINTQWLLLLATMDQADKFGANVEPINHELTASHAKRREANSLYIYERFEDCLNRLDELDMELEGMIEESLDLKDRAMLWTFIIQWLAITGTSMITGFVLWTIMVKRRLYAEVKTTRVVSGE